MSFMGLLYIRLGEALNSPVRLESSILSEMSLPIAYKLHIIIFASGIV